MILFLGAKRDSRKSLKLQCLYNNPKSHQIGVPRCPKVTKMRSKLVPKIINFIKKSKMWTIMKTIVFTMFLRCWDIKIQYMFHTKIIKNHTCNPNMLFDTSNHRKSRKVTPNGLQWGTQNPLKIYENPTWDPSGSPLVHLCSTWSPKWCQSGLQGPPNSPKIIPLGDRNGHPNQQNPIPVHML